MTKSHTPARSASRAPADPAPHRRLDLDCGIARSRIEAWLAEDLGLPCREGAWVLDTMSETGAQTGAIGAPLSTAGGCCVISLETLPPRCLGGLELERTRMVAEGAEGMVNAFEHLFILRFMSAGG